MVLISGGTPSDQLDCPGCFGRGYTYGPTNVYPSTEAQEEPGTIDCPVCHGTGKKPNAQISGGTPSDESGCSARGCHNCGHGHLGGWKTYRHWPCLTCRVGSGLCCGDDNWIPNAQISGGTPSDEAGCSPLRESLAEYAHIAWSGWMKYLFEKSTRNADGTVTIPAWAVERWTRQAETEYADLPENEKNSDRTEADRMIEIMTNAPRETRRDSGVALHADVRQSLANRIRKDIATIGSIYHTVGAALWEEPVERLVCHILASVEATRPNESMKCDK